MARSHWSAEARTGSSRRPHGLDRDAAPSGGSCAPSSCSRSRVASSSSPQLRREVEHGHAVQTRPGGITWLPGGSSPPSTTRGCGGRGGGSSAPKRGSLAQVRGQQRARSSRLVADHPASARRRRRPRRLRAWGSHLTQSHWAMRSLGGEHRDDQVSGDWNAVAEQIIARASARAVLLVAADLDAVEGPQVDRGRQVGLDAVHHQQPVQRRGRGRVELLDRGGLRRHELERERLGAAAP